MEECRNIQDLLDYRTKVENEAIALMAECRFKEACLLLDSLEGGELK